MTANGPVASICIPTFNRAVLLPRAVASARWQTERRIEILISDNASTDATDALAASFAEKDPRVRYVRNPRNLGMVANWNRCLEEARAPLICLLNDDDTLAPEAVATGCGLLARHAEAGMAFGAGRQCRDSGRLLRINRPFGVERVLAPPEAHRTIWMRNCFQITHALFRADAARTVGGFSDEVGWCADTDFTLRMSARSPIAVTPAEMGTYYLHAGQLTGTDNRQVHRWQRRLVERVMAEVAANPDLAALRPLAERGYLSSYAVHFAATALKRGNREECREFFEIARGLGRPFNPRHRAVYFLLRASLAAPGGAAVFKNVLGPALARAATRLG